MDKYSRNLEVSVDIDDIYSRYGSVLIEDENILFPTGDTIRWDHPFTLCSERSILDFYVANISI